MNSFVRCGEGAPYLIGAERQFYNEQIAKQFASLDNSRYSFLRNNVPDARRICSTKIRTCRNMMNENKGVVIDS